MRFIITDVQQTYDTPNRSDKSATQTGIQFGTPHCQLQRSYPNFVWSNIAPLLVTRSIENFWTARTNNGIRTPIHFYVLTFWASYDITWPKPFHYSCPNRNRYLWENSSLYNHMDDIHRDGNFSPKLTQYCTLHIPRNSVMKVPNQWMG